MNFTLFGGNGSRRGGYVRGMLLGLLLLCGAGAWGQTTDVAGIWQGTLKVPDHELRMEMKIVKCGDGKLTTTIYNVDRAGAVIPVTTTTVTGKAVKLSVVSQGMTYEGKLNGDGASMTGTFTQGSTPFPLDFAKVTEAAAWTIPAAPPPVKPMPADAKPVFEVATIKPAKPDEQGKGFIMDGGSFKTINTTLIDLMTFAYGLQQKQIVGGPAWADVDKYDLLGKPDIEGSPSDKQLRAMVRKLLDERFALKYRREKKELSVFALTVAKTGPKLTPNTSDPQGLPGLFFQGLGVLAVRNATLTDFSELMQSAVLDRPVVDETGLTGKYDFTLRWTPDDSQFGGMGAKVPPPTDTANAPPDLFKAVQEQMGVRMDAVKAPAEVLVVDHVEKPSAN